MCLNLRNQKQIIEEREREIVIYKPHSNQKPKIYNRHTHTHMHTHTQKERNPNTTLKIVIKSQGKRAKEEERNKKELQKQPKCNF